MRTASLTAVGRGLLLPGLIVLSVLGSGVGPAAAQSGAPPAADPTASPPPLGNVVVEDSLTQPGLVTPETCRTGGGARELSEEGLVFRLHAACYPWSPEYVWSYSDFRGLTMADGEVRVEARILSPGDRVGFRLYFRVPDLLTANGGYALVVEPQSDRVALIRQGSSLTDEPEKVLALRQGLGKKLGSGAWTALSVRMQGPNMWAFLDDALALSATDGQYTAGGVGVLVARFPDHADTTELALAVHNVKVSALADGDPALAPMMVAPPPPPDAPALGSVVVDDSLTTPAVIPPFVCRTGRNTGENVGEGVIIKVHGRCEAEAIASGLLLGASGLSILDGDAAVDFKIVQGGVRTKVGLTIRARQASSLTVWMNPASGMATLARVIDGDPTAIAERADIHRLASRDDWNRVAIRARGNEAWVLLNGQPIMHSSEASLGVGSLQVAVLRDGALDDETEAAVVFRNLTVSALADGDPIRAPTYQPPPPTQ